LISHDRRRFYPYQKPQDLDKNQKNRINVEDAKMREKLTKMKKYSSQREEIKSRRS
jgi:hypothetical protein